jgi:hypothetical protein
MLTATSEQRAVQLEAKFHALCKRSFHDLVLPFNPTDVGFPAPLASIPSNFIRSTTKALNTP